MSNLLDTSEATPAQGIDADSLPAQAQPDTGHANDRIQSGPLQVAISWLPSLLVFATLIAIAGYGHQHDWKIPMPGTTNSASEAAWCESHGVPEDECIVCQPGLIEDTPELTFCKAHGVHGCVLCVPSLAETKGEVELTSEDYERAARALELRPRKENLAIGSTTGARIQFASIAAMKKAGVDVEPVERRQVVESITAAGEILYDATKTAQVSPQADGIVHHVLVQLGAWVKPGQILAIIDSAEAGRLKTELLAALADERLREMNVMRLRPLAGQAIAGKRLLESENDHRQAIAKVDRAASALNNLGISCDLAHLRGLGNKETDAYVRQLGLSSVPASVLTESQYNRNLVAVTAPLAGQIVGRSTTQGQVVDRGSELFRIADTRTVWVDLRVAAEQAPLVKLEQTVWFMPDGQSQQYVGNVIWISSDVDPTTRTVRVRAELANAAQNLRHELFGRGEIVLREETQAMVVPEQAVQWDGTGQVVFVRDARFFETERPKFFVTRSVRTGVRQEGFTEIIAGVLPGEVVATQGSDVLKAQLLRGKLGAGCTCGH